MSFGDIHTHSNFANLNNNMFPGLPKGIVNILRGQMKTKHLLDFYNDYTWVSSYKGTIDEFVNKPLLLDERDDLFYKILMSSTASAELLARVDIEFLKNKRTHIISPVERYHLITSVCMKPQTAMKYFYDGYPFRAEQTKLVETFIDNDYCLGNIVFTTNQFPIKKLTEYEITLIVNKIVERQDIKRAVKIYYNQAFKLTNQHKEQLSSLIIAAKLSETF